MGAEHERLVGEMSGGQRTRVSLATTLLASPRLLVLDEPTVGLDPVLRDDLWKTFRELVDGGATLLISSHVMDEAERCDSLLLMREGELLATGTPAELCERSRSQRRQRGFRPPHPRARAGREPGGGAVMSARITLSVAARVIRQLRHDPRTIAPAAGRPGGAARPGPLRDQRRR